MGILDQLRDIFVPPMPEESLPTPAPSDMAAELSKLRQFGRPIGALSDHIKAQVLREGEEWPIVLRDEEAGTLTVPSSYLGLIAIMAQWDSLLLDEELYSVRNLAFNMVPMGLTYQEEVRKAKAEEEAEWEHMKTHHPEDFDHMQGGKA